MTQDEALKLALEALENISTALREDDVLGSDIELMLNAITAIKEALAQPVQEPVAWRAPNWGHGDDEWVYRDFDDPVLIADGKPSPNNEALYTTQPQPDERNFCPRCGKRTADLTTIHTCTPPQGDT